MRELLFSVVLFISCSANAYASIIHGKVTGNMIQWTNATTNGNEIQQSVWQSSNSFNLLPVLRWSPAFYQNSLRSLTFTSELGARVETDFKNTGIEFRTANSYNTSNGGIDAGLNTGPQCQTGEDSGGDFLLKSASSCGVNFTLVQQQKLRPFDFYRTFFELPDLLADFTLANVPAGRYLASFSQPVAYFLIYEHQQVESYQIYYDQVQVIIDYKPSFISSVNLIGDGQFDLEYDTEEHSVKGQTKYAVNVSGYINPGIKMSFLSSGNEGDFSLEHTEASSKIPYKLICEKCNDRLVISNGTMSEEYAEIGLVGNNLNFILNFSFNDVYAGEVDEGDYSDAVTIIFELDL
ncbi:hypothetical protein Sps_02878 [Shewanella psychrophila]|uniref:Fimbrial protein n=1 Tax=Shewanella psychrophila TaxID=225848 RepID=A0A1S6HR70_9GAMM|nr:hypothetical protein [Shewanella psychrophila]AQS38026.1 hypothetical protein Sps_02878 [Shewanella psychrophila]